jgi:hypothetical protein
MDDRTARDILIYLGALAGGVTVVAVCLAMAPAQPSAPDGLLQKAQAAGPVAMSLATFLGLTLLMYGALGAFVALTRRPVDADLPDDTPADAPGPTYPDQAAPRRAIQRSEA